MDLASLRSFAREIQTLRAKRAVLEGAVGGIAEQQDVALVRVWLFAPGDLCRSCAMKEACSDRSRCLHLVASRGGSDSTGIEEWSRLDGAARRIPLGAGKIGWIGAQGESLLLRNLQGRDPWPARLDSTRAAGTCECSAHPLLVAGEVLGVLAVYCRAPIHAWDHDWLRDIADCVAAAIANAAAFEEIEANCARLEKSCAELRALPGVAMRGRKALESEKERKARERAAIEAALDRSGGKIYGPTGAAALLGLKPTTLASRIKAMRIHRP